MDTAAMCSTLISGRWYTRACKYVCIAWISASGSPCDVTRRGETAEGKPRRRRFCTRDRPLSSLERTVWIFQASLPGVQRTWHARHARNIAQRATISTKHDHRPSYRWSSSLERETQSARVREKPSEAQSRHHHTSLRSLIVLSRASNFENKIRRKVWTLLARGISLSLFLSDTFKVTERRKSAKGGENTDTSLSWCSVSEYDALTNSAALLLRTRGRMYAYIHARGVHLREFVRCNFRLRGGGYAEGGEVCSRWETTEKSVLRLVSRGANSSASVACTANQQIPARTVEWASARNARAYA